MEAAERAQVVQHWIEVALECHLRKNISTFFGIVCALQSSQLQGLKKTWRLVCRGESPDTRASGRNSREAARSLNNWTIPRAQSLTWAPSSHTWPHCTKTKIPRMALG
ncbi:PREDICTED: ral guanine nucleotide dissociation stimulator-like [Dipodomys ordii]|uniref:Ral guanine nucleotide dissociation stimulator-like n=1 Tax=Dipodomys ordii TaxID=10020 RepID=A0A1S3GK87_DIPOR|nr:PREDICTED: ral guanine nucleotide dissociation stimulator-like [Dipodomys ordii]